MIHACGGEEEGRRECLRVAQTHAQTHRARPKGGELGHNLCVSNMQNVKGKSEMDSLNESD
jgi:hypothetical protein